MNSVPASGNFEGARQPGDPFEVDIEEIGVLSNTVVAETGGAA